MNLRSIVNAATQSINPNIPLTIKVSEGYTIDPATLRQVPDYVDYQGYGNLQALDGDDLGQLNYLNVQGTIRALYVYGSLAGVIRPDAVSTSRILLTSNEGGITEEREWNVFKVLETWPDWCKVAIVYSDGSNS